MNNRVRQTLCDLILKHGSGLSHDPKRCEALLRDHCGEYKREINILINALEERIAPDLLAANRRMPLELLLAKLARRLEDNLAVTPAAAQWAVDSWALALNVVTAQDITSRENHSRAESRTDVNETERRDAPDDPHRNNRQPPPSPLQSPPQSPPRPSAPPIFKPQPAPLPNAPTNNQIAARAKQHPAPINVNAAAPAKKTRASGAAHQSANRRPKPRWFTFGGCFVGCFLLLAILSALLVGAPYAIKVMRETQKTVQPRAR